LILVSFILLLLFCSFFPLVFAKIFSIFCFRRSILALVCWGMFVSVCKVLWSAVCRRSYVCRLSVVKKSLSCVVPLSFSCPVSYCVSVEVNDAKFNVGPNFLNNFSVEFKGQSVIMSRPPLAVTGARFPVALPRPRALHCVLKPWPRL